MLHIDRCGTGLWTRCLARHARCITAVDASPEMLEINRQRVRTDRVRYAQADLFAWAPPGRYDFIFFGFWLSHIPPDRFEWFWDTVAKSLKPGGRAFFIDSLLTLESTATDHAPVDGSGIVERKLNDGRCYRVVKVFYEPEPLRKRLAELGWRGWIRSTGQFFLYGCVNRSADHLHVAFPI